jgi:hypothetical protein
MKISVSSINSHLDEINRLEVEKDSNRVCGFSAKRLKLDDSASEDELLEAFNKLKCRKRKGFPYCEEQHKAFEYAIDEIATTLEEHYSLNVDISNINFSYIDPKYPRYE